MIKKITHLLTRLTYKEPKARCDVWITPYVSLTSEDISPAERATKERISKMLGHYQDRMHTFQMHSTARMWHLQRVEAYWNPGTNNIQVHGTGSRNFYWEGNLTEFFNSDLMLEAA